MKLSAVTLDAPEGLEEFLYELGDGESGFGGTDSDNAGSIGVIERNTDGR